MIKIVYILFLAAATLSLKSQNKFDINDPRNPNCPCHKYQKLADQEYQQLLALNTKQADSKNVKGYSTTGTEKTTNDQKAVAGKEESTNSAKAGNKRRVKHSRIKKHGRWKRMKDTKFFAFLKETKVADACYHWR